MSAASNARIKDKTDHAEIVQRLLSAKTFYRNWTSTYGEQAVRTRQLHRLPGCPFVIGKSRTVAERQRLARGLAAIADRRFIFIHHGCVLLVESAGSTESGARQWRLSEVRYPDYLPPSDPNAKLTGAGEAEVSPSTTHPPKSCGDRPRPGSAARSASESEGLPFPLW